MHSTQLPLCARPIPGTEETEVNTHVAAAQEHIHSVNTNSLLMAQISLSADYTTGHRGHFVPQARGHTCSPLCYTAWIVGHYGVVLTLPGNGMSDLA